MKIINIILLLLLALLQYRLWYGNGSLQDVERLDQLKAAQIEENRKLVERNQSLTAEVIDLKEGLQVIEERARSEMGMIRSGETFYQIVDVLDHSDEIDTKD